MARDPYRHIAAAATLGMAYGRRANMGLATQQAQGWQPTGAPNQPQAEQAQRKSNLRFRSFAERYVVTRSTLFRSDPQGLAEDTWACVLDAKRLYKLIGEVGLNVQDD